jgi:hypothetical protein
MAKHGQSPRHDGAIAAVRCPGRRSRLCRAGDGGVAQVQARPTLKPSPSSMPHPQGVWQKDTPRLGHRRRRHPHARTASDCWDGDRAGGAADHRDDRHRFARMPDPVRPVFLTFGGEVEPGEPFAHGWSPTGCSTARCAGAPPSSASTSSRASRSTVLRCRSRRYASRPCSPTASRLEDPAAGRRRRRPLEAARHGRHQDGRLALRPVRHRLHGARTRGRTTAAPKSISCPPAPSPSCR